MVEGSTEVRRESGTSASSSRVKFIAAWALLLLAKIAIAATLPLFGDEAFYAWEALHPDWAYSDLPAGTALLAGLGTALAGDHAFGLRWPFLLCGALLPWLVVRLAARLGAPEQAWRAGLWSLAIPLLLPLGTLALPDALLTLGVLLVLDAVVGLDRAARAPVTGASTSVLHLQLAVGLVAGALAHYRFAPVLLVGALAWALVGERRLLRAPGLWAAVLVGLLAWLPLLYWNLEAGNAGLRFQFVDRHPWAFEPRGLLQLPAQAIATTPVLWGMLLLAALRGWQRGGSARLLAACVLGLGLFYAVLAPFTDRARFSLHWPLPAWLATAALLPAALDDAAGRIGRGWRIAAAGLAGLMCAAMLAMMAVPALPGAAARLAGTGLYPDNFVGWSEVADALRPRLRPGDVIVADHFMLAAQLSFALDRRADVRVLDHWNNHKHGRAPQLALWGYDEAGLAALPAGTPAWLLFEIGETPEAQRSAWLARTCRWFSSIKPVAVVWGPGRGKAFWLYRAERRAGVSDRACVVTAPPGA